MKNGDIIIRILEEKDDRVFVIDCVNKTMPEWCDKSLLLEYQNCFDEELSIDFNSEDLEIK